MKLTVLCGGVGGSKLVLGLHEEFREAEQPVYIRVTLFVERDSQKGIVIGRGGEVLRTIGTNARQEIEQMVGTRVYLDLRVKVLKEWQRDPKALQRLGF